MSAFFRLQVTYVMVQADGCFTEDGSVILSFVKLRKVKRCKALLRAADIIYTYRVYEECGRQKDRAFALWNDTVSPFGVQQAILPPSHSSSRCQPVSVRMKTAPAPLSEVLLLRQRLAKSSVKKYTAMETAVCPDGRASIGLPLTVISPFDIHLVVRGADLGNALIGIFVHQSFIGEGQSRCPSSRSCPGSRCQKISGTSTISTRRSTTGASV